MDKDKWNLRKEIERMMKKILTVRHTEKKIRHFLLNFLTSLSSMCGFLYSALNEISCSLPCFLFPFFVCVVRIEFKSTALLSFVSKLYYGISLENFWRIGWCRDIEDVEVKQMRNSCGFVDGMYWFESSWSCAIVFGILQIC